MRKSIIIPPFWRDALIAVAALTFGTWRYQSLAAPQLRQLWVLRALIGIGSLLLIKSCFHASIHPSGLVVRFLLIPVRKIPWSDISSAMYIHQWTTNGNRTSTTSGHGFAVRLHGCEDFDPRTNGLNMFELRHPIRFLFIRFTSGKREEYIKLFQEYYPTLTVQIEMKN